MIAKAFVNGESGLDRGWLSLYTEHRASYTEGCVMIIVTLVGGMMLWLAVRSFLPEKKGEVAAVCCILCFLLAFSIDLWLSQDLVLALVQRISRFGPA